MKEILCASLFIFHFSFFCSNAQTIENVFATVQEKNIVVTYNLTNAEAGQTFDIELWYSADNEDFKKCQTINCSDGAYAGITAGNNKSITWIVLQDLSGLECKTLEFEVRSQTSHRTNELSVASGSFTDSRDKNNYRWIKIGSQIIMAENLAYKPNRGNYWAYGGIKDNVEKYGYLYDWETARNVCPVGWHLPSKEEYETLLLNFGGGGSNAYDCLIPGGKSQFSALMGGQRFFAGNSLQMGSLAYFWSSSRNSNTDGWDLYILKGRTNAGIGHYNKNSGFSVRCLKD